MYFHQSPEVALISTAKIPIDVFSVNFNSDFLLRTSVSEILITRVRDGFQIINAKIMITIKFRIDN